MSNLREEKGYTYGVYSQLAPLMHDAYWSISTEVGIDVYESALSEIYKEIDKVQQYEAGAAEMNLLRNYLSARLIQKVDGPFNLASVLRGLIVFDLDIDYFYGLFDTVSSIGAGDLRDLAQKYLRKEDLYEVVLSNKVAVQPSNI
jgi:predicted Zn-dependent peptidase